MSKQTPAASRPPSARCHLLTLLLLMGAFAAGQQAQAQTQTPTPSPWTTTGNNISNTNTGNVGIGTGTTAPTKKLVTAGGALFGSVFSRTELWLNFTTQTNPALLDLNSAAAVSDYTRFAAFSLVTKQSGTAHPAVR